MLVSYFQIKKYFNLVKMKTYFHISELNRHQGNVNYFRCNGIDLAFWFQSLSHRRKVASLCVFNKYSHGKCSELSSLVS